MTSTCTICAKLKKQTTPVTWCTVCAESFCQPCNDHHRVAESSKDHTTILYKDYEQLPSIILSTKTKCSEHQELFTIFCRNHDEPICKLCVKSSHKKCHDVPSINEIVHNVKTSVLFEDAMADVEHVRKTCSNVVKSRKVNIKSLKDTRKSMHEHIEKMFDELIKQLKKVKQNTEAEIDEVIGQEQAKISDVLCTVETYEQMFDNIFKQQDKIKMNASNVQTFLGLKQLEDLVFESQQTLQKLSAGKKLDNTNISFEKYETVHEIIGSMKSFGDVKVSTSPSNVRIDIGRAREAQKEVQRTTEIQLQYQREIDLMRSASYYGCCILPNGMMVFPLYNAHKLYIHNSDGTNKSTINFTDEEKVFDVTAVDDNHFAVTHPESETISTINTNNSKIVKTLKTNHTPHGISHDNGCIFFCVSGKGIMRLSVDSESVDNVVTDKDVSMFSHVCVGYDRVCYTCPNISTVTVLDGQYNVVFKFKDENLLQKPWGISIDPEKNLYVTDQYPNNKLFTISPDGKNCKQLLSKDDGLFFPTAVDFEPQKRKLLIVNQSGPAWKYSVI